MAYVDGFVLPVPKDKIEDYRKVAQEAGQTWMDHGALAYYEMVADEVPDGEVTSFPMSVKLQENETVVFAYILYESREQRDAVNEKVMADPRMSGFDPEQMPFDMKRMMHGGFSGLVTLDKK